MATFEKVEKPVGVLIATVVSGPPLPVKMLDGNPRSARGEKNATVPGALIEGAPMKAPASPLAAESAIRVFVVPSPLKMPCEFDAVIASKATTPLEFMAS